MSIRFNPARHILIHKDSSLADIARTMNREFRTRRFFVYQHRETGNFVLACWLTEVSKQYTPSTGTPMNELSINAPNHKWDTGGIIRAWRQRFANVEVLLEQLRTGDKNEIAEAQQMTYEEQEDNHRMRVGG